MRISGNCLFVTETKVAGQYFSISCNVLAKFVLVYALPRAWRYFFLRFSFFLPPSFSFSRPVFIYNIGAFVFVPFPASRFFRPSIPLRSSVLYGFPIRFHGISPLFFALRFRFAYLRVRFPLVGAVFLQTVGRVLPSARCAFRLPSGSFFRFREKKIAKKLRKKFGGFRKTPYLCTAFPEYGEAGFRKKPVSMRSDH